MFNVPGHDLPRELERGQKLGFQRFLQHLRFKKVLGFRVCS